MAHLIIFVFINIAHLRGHCKSTWLKSDALDENGPATSTRRSIGFLWEGGLRFLAPWRCSPLLMWRLSSPKVATSPCVAYNSLRYLWSCDLSTNYGQHWHKQVSQSSCSCDRIARRLRFNRYKTIQSMPGPSTSKIWNGEILRDAKP